MPTVYNVFIRLELWGRGFQYIAKNQLHNSIITAHAILTIFFVVIPLNRLLFSYLGKFALVFRKVLIKLYVFIKVNYRLISIIFIVSCMVYIIIDFFIFNGSLILMAGEFIRGQNAGAYSVATTGNDGPTPGNNGPGPEVFSS